MKHKGLSVVEKMYNIDKFGGQNTTIKDTALLNENGDIANNCRFGAVGSLLKRSQLSKYNATTMGAFPVMSAYRYYRKDQTLFSLAACGTSMFISPGTNGAFTTLDTGYTEGTRFTFVTYQDLCIYSNGVENIHATDGTVAWELGACKAVLGAAASGQMTAGTKQYSIVFVDPSFTYINGATSNIVTSVGGDSVALSYIPLGPLAVTSRIIYRNHAGGGWRKMHTISDNSTTIWTDTASSGAAITAVVSNATFCQYTSANHGLQIGDWVTVAGFTGGNSGYNGEQIVTNVLGNDFVTTKVFVAGIGADTPTWVGGGNVINLPGDVTDDFPTGKFLYVAQERVFVTGNTTHPNSVYYSETFAPGFMATGVENLTLSEATDYYEQISPNDSDIIVGMRTVLGQTYIFKQNSIRHWRIQYPDVTDWLLGSPLTHVGCSAPYSMADTPDGVVYQAWDHFYLFNGQYSIPYIDEFPIDENILDSKRKNTVGYYWNNLYLWAYTDANAGTAYHNRVGVYDMLRKQLDVDIYGSTATNLVNINCFAAFRGVNEWSQLFAGDSQTGYMYQYYRALNSYVLNTKTQAKLGDTTTAPGQTMVRGSEDSPKIGAKVLDDMEEMTSNNVAQGKWVTSVISATEKIPPDLGDGSDGDKVVSADETLEAGNYDYSSLVIDAGKVLTLSGVTNIKVLGDVTINGTMAGGTSLTLSCVHLTVAAGGKLINGSMTIRAMTVTNNGLIDDDMVQGATPGICQYTNADGSVSFDMGAPEIATLRDGNPATGSIHGGGGNTEQRVWAEFIFPSTVISEARVRMFAQGSTVGGGTSNAYVKIELYYNNQYNEIYVDASNPAGSVGTDIIKAGSWSGVTRIRTTAFSHAASLGGSTTDARIYEISLSGDAPVIDCLVYNAGVGQGSTSDFVPALQCYSEQDTVNEGQFSLQVDCANGAETLNEQLVRAIDVLDISAVAHDKILIDVMSNRTGSNFELGIGEGASPNLYYAVNITQANTWQTVELTYTPDALKDALISLALRFTNTSSFNRLYVDNIRTKFTGAATYISPVIEIGALGGTLNTLYWNQIMPTTGSPTVTFAVRTGNVPVVDGTWTAFSAEFSTPAGSDLTALTAATYFQYRISFNCTAGTDYPVVYFLGGFTVKMEYYKASANKELSVPFRWRSGYKHFGDVLNDKVLKKVLALYDGTQGGQLQLKYEFDNGQNYTYNIDLGVYPTRFEAYAPLDNTIRTRSGYGRLCRIEVSKDDEFEFELKDVIFVYEPRPII